MKHFFLLILVAFTTNYTIAQSDIDVIYEVGSEKLDTPPILENEKEVEEWLNENNRHLEKKKTLSGKGYDKVVVKLTINEEGNIIRARVWRGIGFEYDPEAARLMNELPYKWKPATIDGKNVTAKVLYTVNFLKKK